jgi:DHA1 family bicyclomycin/chloramphenicol resistance-like MFS transporter
VVIARAAVRDLYHGVELARAMSFIVTVFALAPVIAPLLGAATLAFAPWEAIFVVLAAFGAACLVGVMVMPETLAAEHRTDHGFVGAMRQYGTILANSRFRYAAPIAALGSMALFTYISGSPAVLMDSYGLSTTAYALSFAGLSLCFALGAQINMRMLRRRSVSSLLRASVVIQVAASVSVLVGALLHVGLVGFLLPMVIALMTVAGVNSNGLALSLDPFPRGAASAAALVGGMQMIMGAIASALLSAMTLQPSEEMGLGMTLAGSVSLTIIIVALVRGRSRSATTT